MISIQIDPPYRQNKTLRGLLKNAVQQTLADQAVVNKVGLSLVISNDEKLHQLNLEYRKIDAPTDVLSFPAGDLNPETGQTYLGDIIMSYPRAEEQAAINKHSVEAELQLLTVHGVLHLLGFDHTQSEEKEIMWSAQEKTLENLGLAGVQPTIV